MKINKRRQTQQLNRISLRKEDVAKKITKKRQTQEDIAKKRGYR